MGLFGFLKSLFVAPASPASPQAAPPQVPPAMAPAVIQNSATAPPPPENSKRRRKPHELRQRQRMEIRPLQYESSLIRTPRSKEVVSDKPYLFAFPSCEAEGKFLDLSQDADQRWLEYYGLPSPGKPQELAAWFGTPLGRLAWLTNHGEPGGRPRNLQRAHYHYRWVGKRSGGVRLIQSPKPELKRVQELILRKILDKVPTHPAAHGFVTGRSVLTNAAPHVGQRFVLKADLKDFYGSVRYSRVVAIFRALGYSREVAIWLARLCTSATPFELAAPPEAVASHGGLTQLDGRRLPQGAPTSPALANLSAFGLDVRLSGLARVYGMTYTRYADDITLSGPGVTVPALREVIPLLRKIIRSERFEINPRKTQITRNNQRQSVTGVVVNSRPNFAAKEYDRLKAILHNCRKHGPASQNRAQHPHFSDHLRGRVAHVQQLNPQRGAKLLNIWQQINWSR